MCKEKNISKIAFIVFIILQNYLMFNYYFLSESIRTNAQMSYVMFIVVLAISLILVILLPKKISKIKYFQLLKKCKLLKLCLLIAKTIILFMTLYIGTRTLSIALFPTVNPYVFIISLLIITIIVSNFNPENIINTSCILFLVGFFMMIIPLFLNSNIKDFSLLLPITSISSLGTLSCIYLFLDSITLIFFNDGVEVTKRDVMFGVLILFSICIIETLNVLVLCGTNYLQNNEFLGFFSLYIQDTITYIGNLSFIYIYLIPCVCIFKSALSIVFVKNILNINRSILFDIILLCLLFLSISLTLDLGKSLITILLNITIVLLIPIYLFFVVNRNDNIEVTV
ncbi:MAG: hypothetical protein R3Y60_00410 [bacterium]